MAAFERSDQLAAQPQPSPVHHWGCVGPRDGAGPPVAAAAAPSGARRGVQVPWVRQLKSTRRLLRAALHPISRTVTVLNQSTTMQAPLLSECDNGASSRLCRVRTWKLVPLMVRSWSMPAPIPAASAAPQRPMRLGLAALSLNREMDTAWSEAEGEAGDEEVPCCGLNSRRSRMRGRFWFFVGGPPSKCTRPVQAAPCRQ